MPNPSADYPTTTHTPTDTSIFGSQGLGATSPSHTEVHGKVEQEILAIENKIGTGASTPTLNKVLKGTGTGTSAWIDENSYNVLDYGAVGDGTTDDTSAINTVLALGGG